jgi:hypothetical protein
MQPLISESELHLLPKARKGPILPQLGRLRGDILSLRPCSFCLSRPGS